MRESNNITSLTHKDFERLNQRGSLAPLALSPVEILVPNSDLNDFLKKGLILKRLIN